MASSRDLDVQNEAIEVDVPGGVNSGVGVQIKANAVATAAFVAEVSASGTEWSATQVFDEAARTWQATIPAGSQGKAFYFESVGKEKVRIRRTDANGSSAVVWLNAREG